MAALASSDGGQDPVDAAIRAASAKQPIADPPKLTKLVPFDPATKLSEATAVDAKGGALRAVKGAFAVVSKLAEASPTAAAAAEELEGKGFRVLAVAVGATTLKLAGIIALSDPPRPDAANLIKELKALGVRTVMVTGDAPATAKIIARRGGLEGPSVRPGRSPPSVRPEAFAVFAGVMPEDKYHLVQAFQKTGHTVGMCGDGANDAPALRQAQMGIAVSTATDVAKSAAGIVLTKPGLEGVVAAVKEGRITFQRILTYTMNSVTKKIVQVLLPGGGADHHRAGDPDPDADGHHHDHRRLPRHVPDDRQREAVSDAQRLARRRPDAGGHLHGALRAGALRGGLLVGKFTWASESTP
jgi:H+-transporting ATPase